MIPESRIIARLLLEKADDKKWHQAIVIDNLLQKKTPATAKRQTNLIRNRLQLMSSDFWELILSLSTDVTAQALLAASIKHSHLLGDFMDIIIRDRWKTFKKTLTSKDWTDFMEMCAQADHEVTSWTEKTQNKLKQVVFRILAEAKYIESTRSLKMQSVSVFPEIRNYLVQNNEQYVLRCMEITQ